MHRHIHSHTQTSTFTFDWLCLQRRQKRVDRLLFLLIACLSCFPFQVDTQSAVQSVDIFEESDFKPLINMQGTRVPVGPFLRVCDELKHGMVHLSWLQYTPTCLLYDHEFFQGIANFRILCNLQDDGKIPQLPWQSLLPPQWYKASMLFLDTIKHSKKSYIMMTGFFKF